MCDRPLTLYFSLWPASYLSSFNQRAECECHTKRSSVNMQRRLTPSNLSEKLWEVDGEACGGPRTPHWGHCPPFKGSSGSLVMHGSEMPGSSGAESRAGGRTIWERNVAADLRTEIYVPSPDLNGCVWHRTDRVSMTASPHWFSKRGQHVFDLVNIKRETWWPKSHFFHCFSAQTSNTSAAGTHDEVIPDRYVTVNSLALFPLQM